MPFPQCRDEVCRPSDGEIRPCHPTRTGCERQRAHVCANEMVTCCTEEPVHPRSERPCGARALNPTQCEIDGEDLGAWIACAQRGCRSADAAADVQDARWLMPDIFESR